MSSRDNERSRNEIGPVIYPFAEGCGAFHLRLFTRKLSDHFLEMAGLLAQRSWYPSRSVTEQWFVSLTFYLKAVLQLRG